MATATLQTVWDCRWSRPGHHITGVSDAMQPEATWVCTRDGGRRAVGGDECARCSRWELLAAGTAIQLSNLRGAIFSDRVIEEAPAPTAIEVARAALRAVLVVTALGFVAIGVTVLTDPFSVPMTVGLWLCGAALLGLAVFGQFPAE
jgi:hypothetical protein